MSPSPLFARRRDPGRLLPVAFVLVAACSGVGNPAPPGLRAFPLEARRIPLGSSGDELLKLFAARGQIRVIPSESAFVEATLVITAENSMRAREIGAACSISTRAEEGQVLRVYLDPPGEVRGEHIAADYRIGLPPGRRLGLSTVSGLIDTSAYVAKELEVRTRNGEIRVGRVEGELRFRTDSGRVDLQGGFARVTGIAERANVRVLEPSPGSELLLRGKQGNIALHSDPELELRIEYRTIKGRIRSETPLSKTKLPEELPWTRYRLSLNEGRGRPCTARIQLEDGVLRL